MSTAFFKDQIVADDDYPPKIKAILRTPGNERLVTGDEIARPLAGDTETKRPQPGSSNEKPRLCLLKCGRPAAPGRPYCKKCGAEGGQRPSQ